VHLCFVRRAPYNPAQRTLLQGAAHKTLGKQLVDLRVQGPRHEERCVLRLSGVWHVGNAGQGFHYERSRGHSVHRFRPARQVGNTDSTRTETVS